MSAYAEIDLIVPSRKDQRQVADAQAAIKNVLRQELGGVLDVTSNVTGSRHISGNFEDDERSQSRVLAGIRRASIEYGFGEAQVSFASRPAADDAQQVLPERPTRMVVRFTNAEPVGVAL